MGKLPFKILSALDRDYPGWIFSDVSEKEIAFAKLSHDPNLIRGDFNADGAGDYAVQITHGDPRKDRLVIAFLRQNSDFDAHVLESGLSDPAFSPDEVYLQLYSKGQEDYDYDTDKHFRYQSDSVGVRYSRVAGVSYIFEDGRFRRLVTVD